MGYSRRISRVKGGRGMSGAICGGNREQAEKYIALARCNKHKNRKKMVKSCKSCGDEWLQRLDANFMSVM